MQVKLEDVVHSIIVEEKQRHPHRQKIRFELMHKNAIHCVGFFDCIVFDTNDYTYYFEYTDNGEKKTLSAVTVRELCIKILGTISLSIKNRVCYQGIPLGFYEHYGKNILSSECQMHV